MDDEQDTIRCSPETQTTPAQPCEVAPESMVIPKDSEWAGFSGEMAAFLAEILQEQIA